MGGGASLKSLLNHLKNLNYRIPILILIILALIFIPYLLTHAANSVTLTINGGTNAGGANLTIPKGSCTDFTLTTQTTTSNSAGYTLSALLRSNPSDITITKVDGNTPITKTPTAVITTTAPTQGTGDKQTTTYSACASSTIADGDYTLDLAYTLAENQLTYAKVLNGANFQDITTKQSETCSALPIYPAEGSTITMTDNRNNQEYDVRRLQDGKCWMIDNLTLENVTLTSYDSDVVLDYTIPTKTTSGSDYSSVDPKIYGPVPGDTGVGSNRYGYLFNWPAATAGSGNKLIADGEVAPNSICPSGGWRLPGGYRNANDINNDLPFLSAKMDNVSATQGSISTSLYAGWQNTGAFKGVFSGGWGYIFYYQGQDGYFWTSMVKDSSHAHNLYFNKGYVSPGAPSDDRMDGFAVRCLLAP